MFDADFTVPVGGLNIQKLRDCFSNDSLNAICKLDIQHRSRPDCWIWSANEMVIFLIKSVYFSNPNHVPKSGWDLWNSKIHDCLKLLWWQILSNALSVWTPLDALVLLSSVYFGTWNCWFLILVLVLVLWFCQKDLVDLSLEP